MKTSLNRLAIVGSLAVMALFHPIRASSAPIAWTNASGGDWSVAGNWSPNAIPTAADNVFITNNGTYAINLDNGAQIAALTLGGPSGVKTLQVCGAALSLGGTGAVNTNGLFTLCGGA